MKTHADSSQTYQVQRTDCWKTGDCDFVVALEDYWMVQGMEVSSSLQVFRAELGDEHAFLSIKILITNGTGNRIVAGILSCLPKHSVGFYFIVSEVRV
jgi:hypothetical protein